MRYIYVMRERWVITGVEERTDDPLVLRLTKCSVVRVWGTERGLGQLAKDGPTSATKLDPEPDGVEINRADVYRRIPVTSSEVRWQQ